MKVNRFGSVPSGPVAAGAPILVGVSACSLGLRVRWGEGHKSGDFLTGTFLRYHA